MPGNPRDMIVSAERRFPVRIRIGVPPGGFGQRYTEMTSWLDENCGADGWAITPSGMRGVLNASGRNLQSGSHQESLFRRLRLAMKLSAAHQPPGYVDGLQ